MVERRKKKFLENPLINYLFGGVLMAFILIPLNLFALNVNKVVSSPERIEQLENKITKEVIEIKNNVEVIKTQTDKNEEKLNKNDETVLRLEKAITRLEVLIEKISK